MRIEADCPVCDGPLSVWDACKASNPYALLCPHCLSKVLVKAPLVKFFYTLVFIGYIGLGGFAIFQLCTFNFGGYFGWLFAMAGLLVVGQVVVTLVSFNSAELEAGEPDL